MAHQVRYLNDHKPHSPFRSKLIELLEQSKQARASATQWLGLIKALSQKGLKSSELEESGVLEYLEANATATLTKEQVIDHIKSHLAVIKEVVLDTPRFRPYGQPGGTYEERLFIARSERGMVEDELEVIEDEMASLALDLERLMNDMEAPLRLEARRKALMSFKGQAVDFTSHHYSAVMSDEMGKNLVAHARISLYPEDGLMLINEIQSDWAQQGRRRDWNGIPRGPYVTATEAWSGLVLKRLLQVAAQNPKIKQVAWITESMRNGNVQDIAKEKAAQQAEAQRAELTQQTLSDIRAQWDIPSMRPALITDLVNTGGITRQLGDLALANPDDTQWQATASQAVADRHVRGPRHADGLNDFYLKVLPKLANKLLGNAGKVGIGRIQFGPTECRRHAEVPLIELNDATRERLAAQQPTYSRDALKSRWSTSLADSKLVLEAIKRTGLRLGGVDLIRFVTHLIDFEGRRVAGAIDDRGLVVSRLAVRFLEVVDHEVFHFAQERIFTAREMRLLDDAFAPGTHLNLRVLEVLRQRLPAAPDLVTQCAQSSRECAAQAFALWADGQFRLNEGPQPAAIEQLFSWIRKACEGACRLATGLVANGGARWQASEISDDELTAAASPSVTQARVAKLFKALDSGVLAARGVGAARVVNLDAEMAARPPEPSDSAACQDHLVHRPR